MITLNFIICRQLLAYSALTAIEDYNFIAGSRRDDIRALQLRAKAIQPEAFQTLQKGNRYQIATNAISDAGLANFLLAVTNEPIFDNIFASTKEAVSKIENEWNTNFSAAQSIVSDITRLSLDGTFDVFVNHPSLRDGVNLNKVIFFTYQSNFGNDNTIYLWHEVLHCFIDVLGAPRGDGTLEHIVIQLVADEELRIRLNGGGYPPFIGHKSTWDDKLRLMPAWRTYLGSPNRNILQFIETESERTLSGAQDIRG